MKIKSAAVVKCFNEQFFSLLLKRRKQTLETNYKPMHMHSFHCPVYHSDVVNYFTVHV